MNQNRIYVEKGDIPTIGVKAFNLYRCRLLDIEVPDFVVIPIKWFKEYKSCGVSKNFYLELKKLFVKFNCELVVRSSSVEEDLNNRSNAGIYRSVLGVDTFKKLVKAIEVVWSSSNGSDMAVIIQKQVTPELAGVLFTRNPINGKAETVIEYIEDFGAPLVSGKKNPVKVVVNNYLVNGAHANLEKITRSMKSLTDLSKKIEADFGYPLDIEWAKFNGKFHILQARPITALPVPNMNHTKTYSRVTAEQFYSGPVSLLFFSIFNHMYSNFYIKDTIQTIGIDVNIDEILVRHKNFLYIDTKLAQEIFRNFPIKNQEFLTVFPVDIRDDLIKRSNGIRPSFVYKIFKFLIKKPNYWISKLDKYFIDTVAPSIIQDLESLPHFKKMKKTQLKLALAKLFEIANKHIETSKWGLGLYIMPLLNGLERILKRNDIDTSIFQFLISGLNINKTLDASMELKRLCKIIKKNKHMLNIFQNEYKSYFEYKTALESVEKGEFIIEYFEFILKKFGHRRLSRDILAPSWNDEPMIPFTILRSLVLEKTPEHPQDKNDVRAQKSEMIKTLESQLSLIDRIKLKILIKYLIRYIGFREHQRFYLDMIISKMRELVLEIGKHMVKDNLLLYKDDIFYLELSDLEVYLSGKVKPKFHKKVEFNKTSFRNEQRAPGKYMRLGVDFDTVSINRPRIIKKMEKNANIVHGQPVSPGYISGRVRVVENIDSNIKLEKHDVLVTRSIDPGQTHAFLLAGGLVLEVGGILSHGAILAREFKLPTVANVKNATRLFKDGQEIIVDGTKGEVLINKNRGD